MRAAGGRHPKLTITQLVAVEREMLRNQDVRLEAFRGHTGAPVSIVAIHKTLWKLGFTRKKNCYTRAINDVPTYPYGVRIGRRMIRAVAH